MVERCNILPECTVVFFLFFFVLRVGEGHVLVKEELGKNCFRKSSMSLEQTTMIFEDWSYKPCKEEHQGWHDGMTFGSCFRTFTNIWLSFHMQNFIGRDWRFAHKGLGSYVNSWPGQWWETYSQVHLRGNGWPSTAPASSPRWGGGVWRWMMEMNPDCICVSLRGNILAWGCHKTSLPDQLCVNILTWMFVHWLHQVRGHCALKVAIVGGTSFADDANTFIEQRP